jgi:hypothetical protein
MVLKQIALGLVLFSAPTVANAGWRAVPAHNGPREPPPPPIEEHPHARAGFVWSSGHHEWRHGHYVWMSGRPVRMHRGHDWYDGRWEHHEDHYDWHRGGWRAHR